MGLRLTVATLLSSIALAACGGAHRGEAKGPEADPWAGYQGTYATAAGASGSPAARIKSARVTAAETAEPKQAAVEVAAPSAAPSPVPTPIASTAKKGKAAPAKAAAKAIKTKK